MLKCRLTLTLSYRKKEINPLIAKYFLFFKMLDNVFASHLQIVLPNKTKCFEANDHLSQ
jgi:hypothetical protein